MMLRERSTGRSQKRKKKGIPRTSAQRKQRQLPTHRHTKPIKAAALEAISIQGGRCRSTGLSPAGANVNENKTHPQTHTPFMSRRASRRAFSSASFFFSDAAMRSHSSRKMPGTARTALKSGSAIRFNFEDEVFFFFFFFFFSPFSFSVFV